MLAEAFFYAGGYLVLSFVAHPKGPPCSRILNQEFLELRVPQQLHRLGKIFAQRTQQVASELVDISVGDPFCKLFAGLAAHVLLDPSEALNENIGVILAVDILPDVLDNLWNRKHRLLRRFDLEI